MVLLCGVSQLEAHFGPLEKILILTQDRYTVCAECVIGSKIVLGTPDGNPRSCGLSRSSFVYIWRQC
jgi:hypothetical protein